MLHDRKVIKQYGLDQIREVPASTPLSCDIVRCRLQRRSAARCTLGDHSDASCWLQRCSAASCRLQRCSAARCRLQRRSAAKDCWAIVGDNVYDVTFSSLTTLEARKQSCCTLARTPLRSLICSMTAMSSSSAALTRTLSMTWASCPHGTWASWPPLAARRGPGGGGGARRAAELARWKLDERGRRARTTSEQQQQQQQQQPSS